MGILDSLLSSGYMASNKDEEEKRRRMLGGMEDPTQTYGKIEQPKAPTWDEGGKFTWKDGLALALTGVGDAFTRAGGGEGGAMSEMMGRAMNARAASRKAQMQAQSDAEKYRQGMSDLIAVGYAPEQASTIISGLLNPSDLKPDQWTNRAGDRMSANINGEVNKLYTDNSPVFQTTQDGVYAMDPHTGGNYRPNTDGLPHVQSQEDKDRLPDGAQYIAPDGTLRTKRGGGVSNGTSGFPIPRIR